MSEKMVHTYSLNVLGCKVNQYDAQQIEELLQRYGLTAAGPNPADLIIVHTCGVTATAAQKSRQSIRRLQRSHPEAHLLVTGCAAKDNLTAIEDESVQRIPAGKEWLQRLAEQIERLPLPRTGLSSSIETDETTVQQFGEHTRAFLKIQDGCDIGCSYCIVPSLRKAPRDKSPATALQEADQLTQNGYREIVIAGVSVGLYGRNSEYSLAALLRDMVQLPHMGRIRLSSLHPAELTDELLEVWAASPHIMPHLHLSLQSGSNEILTAMRRGYTAEDYLAAVEKARSALDNPAFTTDVIVGFPGETEAHFSETMDFCKAVGFSRIHTFSFSPRPGTVAATLSNQVNGKIAAQRNSRLQNLASELSLSYHNQFIGKTIPVLIETVKESAGEGYSPQYVPVSFTAAKEHRGSVASILVERADQKGVYGKLIF